MRSADADASTTRVNNAAYRVFGASIEQASSVGTYIPVGGTAITTGPTGLSRTTGTLVSIVMPRNWTSSQDGATGWNIVRGSDSTPSRIAGVSASSVSATRGDTAGSEPATTATTFTSGQLTQLAMSWSASAVNAFSNGTVGTPDSTLAAPFDAVTSLSVGAISTGTNAFFGYVLCLYSHQQVVPASTLYLIYANTTAP